MDGKIIGIPPEAQTIQGTLSAEVTLTGGLTPSISLAGTLTIPTTVDSDPYQGEYTVIPRVYMQSLATSGKYMKDDVTITEISVTRTSNPQGGQTVLIG